MVDPLHRTCKRECIRYRAKKQYGSRYAVGQVRCQICDIYLIPLGVKDERFCKCCNFRVRTKPRNRVCKEKYYEQVRNIQNSWHSITKTRNTQFTHMQTNDLDNDKNSTSIYNNTNQLTKTYYELKAFLSELKPQVNYHYVMLKVLLEHKTLHKGQIAESLAYFNNKDTTNMNSIKFYLRIPVYDILLNNEFVTLDKTLSGLPSYTFNVKLGEFQRFEIYNYLTNAIISYNKKHGILDNVFPNANNMGNIDWSTINIKNILNIQFRMPHSATMFFGGFNYAY